MTVSDELARPADAPPAGDEWKKLPGARDYEWSHRGKVRSLDRTINGRFYEGLELKLREDGDGYYVVNYTDDERVRHHGVSVARMILMAHDPGGYRPGLHACHGPGGQKDNRWPENLRWDTPDANREEALELRLLNSPPKVKPPKVCPRCGAEHAGRGRNCHACVVQLGVDAARLRVAGVSLQEAADRLDYPPVPLDVLAVKYGGLRFVIEPDAGHSPSWLRRVKMRAEAWLADSDGE